MLGKRSPNEREREIKKRRWRNRRNEKIIIENRFSQRWFLILFAAKRAPVYLKNTFGACIGGELSGTGLSDILLRFRIHWRFQRALEFHRRAFISPVNHNGTTILRCNRKPKHRTEIEKIYIFFFYSFFRLQLIKNVTCLVIRCYFAGNGRWRHRNESIWPFCTSCRSFYGFLFTCFLLRKLLFLKKKQPTEVWQ